MKAKPLNLTLIATSCILLATLGGFFYAGLDKHQIITRGEEKWILQCDRVADGKLVGTETILDETKKPAELPQWILNGTEPPSVSKEGKDKAHVYANVKEHQFLRDYVLFTAPEESK